MKPAPFGALVLAGVLASCSGIAERDRPAGADATAQPLTLRLDLSDTTPEAGTRRTFVDLTVPEGWRTASKFEGAWSQPEGAPTLMLVAGGYDDGHRAGTYEARRRAGRISINLHPAYFDNNVTLAFTMVTETDGAGRWGHATFAGYQEKGPVRVQVTGP